MFEVEMISFVDHKAADDFQDFSKQERERASLEQLMAVANAEREVRDWCELLLSLGPSGSYSRVISSSYSLRLEMTSFNRRCLGEQPASTSG